MPSPDLDAAIQAISTPERLKGAQELVAGIAPDLQRILGEALTQGGWFDTAHNAAVKEATGIDDAQRRLQAIRTIFAEETRLSMLVGVAVGLELARELGYAGQSAPNPDAAPTASLDPDPDPIQEDPPA